jgi:hypothetical protein
MRLIRCVARVGGQGRVEDKATMGTARRRGQGGVGDRAASSWHRGRVRRRRHVGLEDAAASGTGRRFGRIGVRDMAPSIWRRRRGRRRGHGGTGDRAPSRTGRRRGPGAVELESKTWRRGQGAVDVASRTGGVEDRAPSTWRPGRAASRLGGAWRRGGCRGSAAAGACGCAWRSRSRRP